MFLFEHKEKIYKKTFGSIIMNTLWHVVWAYFVFRKRSWYWKALLFSIIPDIPSLLALSLALLKSGASWDFFNTIHSGWWMISTNITHSLVLIAALFLIAVIAKVRSAFPFFYGWLAHVGSDIITHATDGPLVFWPVSSYKIFGLLSYWEAKYHAVGFNTLNLIAFSIVLFCMLKTKENKRFEAKFFSLALVGIVASFFFLVYVQPEYRSLQFILANCIAIIVSLIFLIKNLKYIMTDKFISH